jgi:hypothetical protein
MSEAIDRYIRYYNDYNIRMTDSLLKALISIEVENKKYTNEDFHICRYLFGPIQNIGFCFEHCPKTEDCKELYEQFKDRVNYE